MLYEASFDESTINAVWRKGQAVSGYDPDQYRKDLCGAWMSKSQYGDRDASMGWEIDHIVPRSHGGGDDLNNLQPLQWENNRAKSDNYPNWSCAVSAQGS